MSKVSRSSKNSQQVRSTFFFFFFFFFFFLLSRNAKPGFGARLAREPHARFTGMSACTLNKARFVHVHRSLEGATRARPITVVTAEREARPTDRSEEYSRVGRVP